MYFRPYVFWGQKYISLETVTFTRKIEKWVHSRNDCIFVSRDNWLFSLLFEALKKFWQKTSWWIHSWKMKKKKNRLTFEHMIVPVKGFLGMKVWVPVGKVEKTERQGEQDASHGIDAWSAVCRASTSCFQGTSSPIFLKKYKMCNTFPHLYSLSM